MSSSTDLSTGFDAIALSAPDDHAGRAALLAFADPAAALAKVEAWQSEVRCLRVLRGELTERQSRRLSRLEGRTAFVRPLLDVGAVASQSSQVRQAARCASIEHFPRGRVEEERTQDTPAAPARPAVAFVPFVPTAVAIDRAAERQGEAIERMADVSGIPAPTSALVELADQVATCALYGREPASTRYCYGAALARKAWEQVCADVAAGHIPGARKIDISTRADRERRKVNQVCRQLDMLAGTLAKSGAPRQAIDAVRAQRAQLAQCRTVASAQSLLASAPVAVAV